MRGLVLPIAVVIGCGVLGGFYYVVEVNKQKSIEFQQQVNLNAKKSEDDAQAAQNQKEYIAKRKNDCLAIYKTENDKWNNVTGWRYDQSADVCKIEYKSDKPKTDAECDKSYPTNTNMGYLWFFDNILCKDGKFENSF